MHTLKKLYCRCFQISFRAALPLMPYREPKLIDGFSGVSKVLRKHNITRLLLVTDPGVYSLGLTTPLEQILKKAGITCIVYKDTVANPTSANVEDAKNLYLKKHCQALLAFGGGSSMDCAKGVGARLARPNKSLAKMEGILHVMHKLPLLIAVSRSFFADSSIHACLFRSLLLRFVSVPRTFLIFFLHSGQYFDIAERGTYSMPHTVQFLGFNAVHRFVGVICNSPTKPMNL